MPLVQTKLQVHTVTLAAHAWRGLIIVIMVDKQETQCIPGTAHALEPRALHRMRFYWSWISADLSFHNKLKHLCGGVAWPHPQKSGKGKGAVRGSIVDLWACNYSCRVNALRNVITLRATFARSPGRVCVVRTSKSLKWDVTPTGKRSACVLLYRAMHLRRDVFITPNQLRRMRAQWWMPKLDWVHFLQVKSWTGSTQIGFGTLLVWWVCFFSCQIHFWK